MATKAIDRQTIGNTLLFFKDHIISVSKATVVALTFLTFLTFDVWLLTLGFWPSRRSGAPGLHRQARVRRKIRSAVAGACKVHHFDGDILALAIPTLGVVLIDPCLSLVDTGYVGRLGALSLAALGPCAAAFNFVFISAR